MLLKCSPAYYHVCVLLWYENKCTMMEKYYSFSSNSNKIVIWHTLDTARYLMKLYCFTRNIYSFLRSVPELSICNPASFLCRRQENYQCFFEHNEWAKSIRLNDFVLRSQRQTDMVHFQGPSIGLPLVFMCT